jgi:hypothetical protein
MAFMEPQITRRIAWVEIDGNCGTTWVPLDDVDAKHLNEDSRDEVSESEREYFGQYYEGGSKGIRSINVINGYGARLSAPGYLDCTDWAVFDTAQEARDYLTEMYGDDDDETTN